MGSDSDGAGSVCAGAGSGQLAGAKTGSLDGASTEQSTSGDLTAARGVGVD